MFDKSYKINPESSFRVYKPNNTPKLKTNITEFNELLGGGFEKGLFYLIYGERFITKLLISLLVNAQLPNTYGGINTSVVMIDGENSFNPYSIAHLAAEKGLSPTKALENIQIVRVFNQVMMEETILKNLSEIVEKKKSKLILVTGLATHLLAEGYKIKDAKKMTQEAITLRNIAMRNNAIVVASTPKAPNSDWKPSGGTALQHTAQVHVAVVRRKNLTEFFLMKHPSIPNRKTILWGKQKPQESPMISLDFFFDKNKKLEE
ncbi:MAG: hypothetical protein ACTSUV_02925 [Candidatus Ranarchaeia archaeon]